MSVAMEQLVSVVQHVPRKLATLADFAFERHAINVQPHVWVQLGRANVDPNFVVMRKVRSQICSLRNETRLHQTCWLVHCV